MNQAKKDFDGKVKIVSLLLDTQENVAIADQYQIQVVPTYVFLDSKGNVVDKAMGALNKDALYAKVKTLEGQ